MGRDKAEVEIEGRPMLHRVADAMGPSVSRVVLLGPDRPGWECWPDSVHASGPLAGIATALSRTDADQVLVVAVDNAFARPETLARIVGLAGPVPVVPVDEAGIRQVTCALYPRSIAAAAVAEASSEGTIQTLLDRVSFRPVAPSEWREWDEDGRSWFSADSPEAVAVGSARFQAR